MEYYGFCFVFHCNQLVFLVKEKTQENTITLYGEEVVRHQQVFHFDKDSEVI